MTDDETLARSDDVSILRFRRRLTHPPSTVWTALTEDRHLAGWFPTTVEGERVAGAPLHFSFRESEGAPFDGEMTCYDPPAVLELRWGDDLLRFELEPERDGEGCVLTLTVTFAEHGKAARDAAGWHVCLERLAHGCDGTEPPWDPSERWREVHPQAYARAARARSICDRASWGVIGTPEE